MLLTDDMKNAANDNHGLLTRHPKLAGRRVSGEKLEIDDVTKNPEGGTESADQKRAREKRSYVDQRLRDLAAFERRQIGRKN